MQEIAVSAPAVKNINNLIQVCSDSIYNARLSDLEFGFSTAVNLAKSYDYDFLHFGAMCGQVRVMLEGNKYLEVLQKVDEAKKVFHMSDSDLSWFILKSYEIRALHELGLTKYALRLQNQMSSEEWNEASNEEVFSRWNLNWDLAWKLGNKEEVIADAKGIIDSMLVHHGSSFLMGSVFVKLASFYTKSGLFEQAQRSIRLATSYWMDIESTNLISKLEFVNCELAAIRGDVNKLDVHKMRLEEVDLRDKHKFRIQILDAYADYVKFGNFHSLYRSWEAISLLQIQNQRIGEYLNYSELIIKACRGADSNRLESKIKFRNAQLVEFQRQSVDEMNILSAFDSEAVDKKSQNKGYGLAWMILFFTIPVGVALLIISKNKPKVEPRKNAEISFQHKSEDQSADEVLYVVAPEYIQNIESVLSDHEVLFDPNLNLPVLARKLNTNTTYLSKAVNTHFQMNFSMLVTSKRIESFCTLALDPDYENFKIEVLAEMVGYKSKSTFNKHFKSLKGVTPSVFINEYKKATTSE